MKILKDKEKIVNISIKVRTSLTAKELETFYKAVYPHKAELKTVRTEVENKK